MLLFLVGAIIINLSLMALSLEPKYDAMEVAGLTYIKVLESHCVYNNYTPTCISRIHIHNLYGTCTLVELF
jgi:hypothetical protein